MMLPLFLLAGSSCTDGDEYTQGQWIKRSGFEAEPRAYASSFTIGEKGYLCGGFRGANKEYMNDLWVYDMNNNNWEQLASMPTAGRKYATAFALNGRGYVTTGSVKNGSLSDYVADTWEYNPDTDVWTQKDDFKGGARDGALAFVVGGYAYVGTGNNDDTQGTYKDFYRFDPNAAAGSQWSKDPGNGGGPEKRAYGTAFVIGDVAYVCGGKDNSTNVTDFWKFDGSTWTQLRDIADTNDDEDYDDDYAIARYSTVSFVIDGYAYLPTGNRSGVTSDYWKYDPDLDWRYGDSADAFTPLTNVHNNYSGASSRDGAVSFSNGQRGFVLTGQSGGSYFDDVYELLPDEEEEV